MSRRVRALTEMAGHPDPATAAQTIEVFRALPEPEVMAILDLLQVLASASWYEAGGEPPRLTIETDKLGVKFLLTWLMAHGAGYSGGEK